MQGYFLSPWLTNGCPLATCAYGCPSVQAHPWSLCFPISFYKDISQIGLGHTLMGLILTQFPL